MGTRSANETIKGYFYQFDYSIKKILECPNPTDSITVEGIEDVDIDTATDETAIQCKYYSKTEYNHSVIAKPIRFMLSHFFSERKKGNAPIKYTLYGFYKSGQHKLRLPISAIDLKDNFLTYTKKEVKQFHHINIGASDSDLIDFISNLEIDINAQEYDAQLNTILTLLKSQFNCTDFESEHYYYNNALDEIRQLAIENEVTNRIITKADFLKKINNKVVLFNKWFIEFKGLKKHFKELRIEYFTALNSSSFDRFFLIEIERSEYLRADLKELVFLISKKWSKISRRETNPFCPYVLINGIESDELIEFKKELYSETFIFIDGFPFLGSDFNPKSVLAKPDFNNGISLKFLNEVSHLEEALAKSRKTKEIYQFYLNRPFFTNDNPGLKHIKIQVNEFKSIKEII